MFSISNLKSSAEAGKYYQADNYYLAGAEDHLGLSVWYGKAAKELGLKGEIKQEDFQKLLEGKLPNGVILGKKEGDEIKHFCGIDGTFSAPKSVSIMAEVYKDRRLVDAHNKAVEAVLKHVEESYARTRIKIDGEMKYEKTGNLAIAKFTHNISRAMDPQLHTHCVILNMTKREDGKWRSTEFHNIYDDKLYLGQLYRADLAMRVQELGYEIHHSGKLNQFELSCVAPEAIETFSKRSSEIKDFLGEYADYASAETKAKATLDTRDSKKKVNQRELDKEWNAQIDESSIYKDKIHSTSYTKSISQKTKDAAFEYAVEKAFERSSIATSQDVISAVLEKTLGACKRESVEPELKNKIESKELLRVRGYNEDNIYFTTPAAIALEKQTIKLMRGGQNTLEPILDRSQAEVRLRSSGLNDQQKSAALEVLSTKDRIIGIQGYAGVGKTFLFNEVKKLMDENNVRLIGLTPTAKAAGILEKDTDIGSQTIQRFLGKYDGVINNRATNKGLEEMRKDLANTCVILDEASLASTRMFHDILKLSHDLRFRIIAIGDTKQLDAVEAGKPFAQLQRAGMSTAKIGEIVRQKNAVLKEAIYDSIKGDIKAAITKVDKVVELGKDEYFHQKTVEQFMSVAPDVRNKTLIVTSLNATRQAINLEIHKALKKEGTLSEQGVILPTFEKLDLLVVERKNPFNYKPGNTVIFNKDISNLKIKANEIFEVVAQNDKSVTLTNSKGKIVNFIPEKVSSSRAKYIEIFDKKNNEYNVGERIKFTTNSKVHTWVKNNADAKIMDITPKHISFELKDGSVKELSVKDRILQFTNYSYCQTVHSAQGSTVGHVIAAIPAKNKLTTQKQFYVAISRAEFSATIITDNMNALITQLQKTTGERISAIDGRLGYLNDVSKSKFVKETITATTKTKQTSSLEKTHNTKDIYNTLYDKLPSAFPEFGFVSRGSHMVSSTTAKVDGGSGTKGKVYVYANNPGTLVDYTRGNISIWEYVQTRVLGSGTQKEVYSYLTNITGLDKSPSFKISTPSLQKPAAEVQKEKPDYELNQEVQKYTQNLMFSIKNNHVMEYLKKERGYTHGEIAKMGVGFLPSKKKLGAYLSDLGYEKDRVDKTLGNLHFMGQTHKLLIPFESSDGKVIGFVARYVGKDAPPNDMGKYLYSKGLSKSDQLFNLNNVKGKEVLVVEGIFDCLSAKSKGMDNVVALGGTSFNINQLELLKQKGIAKVNICLDNDVAGKGATNKINHIIISNAPQLEIKNIIMPSKFKDMDDVLKKISIFGISQLPAVTIDRLSKTAELESSLTHPSRALPLKKHFEITTEL